MEYCNGGRAFVERQELKSLDISPEEVVHGLDVLVWRNYHGVSLVVNGKNASQKVIPYNSKIIFQQNTVASFSPATDLYIGGFPPAFMAADGVPHSSFLGCIENVRIPVRYVHVDAPFRW